MSDLIFIDTSAWILALKKGNEKATEKVDGILAKDRAATSGVILLELLGGARKSSEFEELKKDLMALHYFSITDALWEKSSKLAFDLRRHGLTVPATDVLIASVALDNNCLLLHADSHFKLIAKYTNLKIETLQTN